MFNESFSIVIVESQPLMRSALNTTLSAEGMTILAVLANSEQVVRTASILTPNLILFSLSIPGWDDLQVISTLRKELPSVLILALVTGEFREQEQAAQEHGAHMVLTKTVPRSELIKTVKRLKKFQFVDF